METFTKHKLILIFLAGIITAVVLKQVFDFMFFSKEIIRRDCDAKKEYCFYAMRYKKFLSSEIIFGVARFQEKGTPDYGHFLTFPFGYYGSNNQDDLIKKGSVEFTDEGIVYTHPTNHVLLIPKKEYIGGR